jgi:uncharacterized protein YfaS (alpha-2-macroglobulin family)
MREDHDAQKTIAPIRFVAVAKWEIYDDPMTRNGFLLYVLSKHFPERLPDLAPGALEDLANNINRGFYHSLSAGTTLLGLNAYVAATHADTAPALAIREILRDKTVRPLELPAILMPKVAFSDAARGLRFSSSTDFNVFYMVNQSGFDHTPPREAIVKGFEILREYTDDQGHPLTQVKMGEQLAVHLKYRASADNANIAQVALVDLLPGGFELVIPTGNTPAPTHSAASQDSDGDDNAEGEPGETTNTGNSGACTFCSAGYQAPELTFADPREDRVVFYGSLTSGVQEVIYRIKATNIGTYTVPPAYGEAMYDRNVVARSIAGKIEVVKP